MAVVQGAEGTAGLAAAAEDVVAFGGGTELVDGAACREY